MNSKLLAAMAASSVLGICTGHYFSGFTPTATGRAPTNVRSLNDFTQLPCPSETEFQKLAERVHLSSDIPGESTCDDSIRGKMAKILFLLDSLKTQVPENWGGAARETLLDPIEYVAKMTPKMSIDFKQKTSVAMNAGRKEIFLGGLFFTSDPLYSLSVLIHESRHSSADDPGHTQCRYGDIPKSAGGCDQFFSSGEDAGAYSFGALFLLGLAQFHENLLEADKEYLLSAGLTLFGTRFNLVPEQLASPHDLLFVLGESGQTYLLNPYNLQPELVPQKTKVTRLEHYARHSGAFLYDEAGKVHTWTTLHSQKLYEPELLNTTTKVQDINKVYISTDSYAYTMLLNAQGDLLFFDVQTDSGEIVLKKFRIQPLEQGYQGQRILMANYNMAMLLGQDGKAYALSIRSRGGGKGGTGNRFIPYTFLPHEQPWEQLYGGILYDSLYGIAEGKLYIQGFENGEARPALTQFQGKGSLKKYFEGTNFRVLLNENGELFLKRFSESAEIQLPQTILPEKIVDFTIVRHFSPVSKIWNNPQQINAFTTNCQTHSAVLDPWLRRPFGIKNGGLVTVDNNGSCQELKNLGPVESFRFSYDPQNINNNFFSQVYLELTPPNGAKKIFRPYDLF